MDLTTTNQQYLDYLQCNSLQYNCIVSMYKLGNYYFKKKDYEKMFKYYALGVDNNCPKCMYKLTLYYKNNNDNDNFNFYYQLTINTLIKEIETNLNIILYEYIIPINPI